MKIMSVNAGSSSLKFSLFDMKDEQLIASGYFERVGIEGSFYTIKYNGEKIKEEIDMPNHTVAVEILLNRLLSLNIIESLDEIDGVGHRTVNGGERYSKSVLITDKVIEDLTELKELAPLHNPAGVLGIEAVRSALPNVPMVAVFDTAFHQTLSEEKYLYPVPYEWYKEHGVRKYGFHGTSHRYVALEASKILGRKDLKTIICHLGSGASISAVKDLKSVDTSMGFTPLTGVVMGTRSGDVDPSIIPYIMEKEGMNASEVVNALNKRSGLLGISGVSNDCRDVEDAIQEGNERARLALNMFVNSVVDYIAKYYVELGGIDCLCFTAGIGENGPLVREMIVNKLSCLGVSLDVEANASRGKTVKISTEDSKFDIYVIPTNEELMIAKDTVELIG